MKGLIFGDTHSPFHDPLVTKLILHVIFKWKPDLLIHAGDMFDCNAVSKYPKDPNRTHLLKQEMSVGHQILALVPEGTKRVFCMGNHEDRIRRYMWHQAPEVWGFLAEDQMIGLTGAGWHCVPRNESFHLGDLVVTHDFGRHGKTAVKDAMELHPGKTVVIGHTHRLESLMSAERGLRTHGLSTGWGGIVEAVPFTHHDRIRKEWRHGFVAGYIEDNGEAHFQDVPIFDRCRCFFDREHYEVKP